MMTTALMTKTIGYKFEEHLIHKQAKAEAAMLKEFEQGQFTMEAPLIKYNPYFVNDLAAVMLFRTEEETSITDSCTRENKRSGFLSYFS